jgi:hypothetical protein
MTISGVRGAGHKEAYTVHTTNISSQRQYFVARYLMSYVGNVFGLHSIYTFFFYQKASNVGKAHRLAPTTVHEVQYGCKKQKHTTLHPLICFSVESNVAAVVHIYVIPLK